MTSMHASVLCYVLCPSQGSAAIQVCLAPLNTHPTHVHICGPQVAKVEKAVLSTTAKARERQRKKDAEKAAAAAAKGETAPGESPTLCTEYACTLHSPVHHGA